MGSGQGLAIGIGPSEIGVEEFFDRRFVGLCDGLNERAVGLEHVLSLADSNEKQRSRD
jgi:hypothetical protein